MTLLEKIAAHRGHSVEVATYGDPDDPQNATVECLDCGEVIVDSDTDEEVQQ